MRPDEPVTGDVLTDDEPAGRVDLWRLAGALAVFGAALIGAAILANRVSHPVRLPADDLAESYRDGWAAGRASLIPELEAERAHLAELEAELGHLRDRGLTVTPEPGPLEPVGETFGKVAAETPPTT